MYLKVDLVWVKCGLRLSKEFHKFNFRVLSGFWRREGEGGGGGGEGGTKKPTQIVLGISPIYFTLNTRIYLKIYVFALS